MAQIHATTLNTSTGDRSARVLPSQSHVFLPCIFSALLLDFTAEAGLSSCMDSTLHDGVTPTPMSAEDPAIKVTVHHVQIAL